MSVSDDFIAGLPDPDIIETLDVEAMITAIRDDLVGRFPSIAGVIDLESEPSRMLIEAFGYRELLIRARVNDGTRANLLKYATGADLDQLAAFYDVTRLVDELDDALRSRVILAISGRSPGGTEARYEYIARSADVRVASAKVYKKENDPTVYIAILATDNGGLADQALLDAVIAAIDQPDAGLISDTIVIEAAVQTTTDITADIWLYPTADAAAFDGLEAILTAAWLIDGGIGRDLNLAWITKTLMQPGIQRVEIVAPTSRIIVPYNEAATIGTVTLTNKGRDV